MSEFKLPHVEDLTTNSKLPGQLTENFKAIEQEDKDDDQAFVKEVQDRKDADISEQTDRKKGDGNLQGQINKINDSLKNKATFDDLTETKNELQQRINHLYAGDPRTIKTVVKEILEEKGVI